MRTMVGNYFEVAVDLPNHLRGRDFQRVETAGTAIESLGPPMGVDGQPAIFRQVYRGSPLPGIGRIRIDDVDIRQVEGPVEVREVYVHQEPTPSTVSWVKAHHKRRAGIGTVVTLAELPVTITEGDVGIRMVAWSKRCRAAVGLLAACLDERATYEFEAENLVVLNPDGSVAGVADQVKGVRDFGPLRRWDDDMQTDIEGLRPNEALRMACRWFLRAQLDGVSETGYLMLATAIESLVNDPRKGKPSFEVKGIREAFLESGGSEEDLKLSIGHCNGLRAEIVHKGVEDHSKLREAWYSLELIARTLLRERAGFDSPWPICPSTGTEDLPALTVTERHFVEGHPVE